MFKIDELAGQLIKSGRFTDAIPVFGKELEKALAANVVTKTEVFGETGIIARFNRILLKPNNVEDAQKLGDDLICIAIRIPYYVKKAGETSSSYTGIR
jgi:hypothetical protein